jgi:SpoVK/Ycf46/Vps4 family AAA+-type ATPase
MDVSKLTEKETSPAAGKVGRASASTGSSGQLLTLIRAHARGDDDHFYSVALQMAADSARKGHHRVADDIKAMVAHGRKKGARGGQASSMRPEIQTLFLTRDPRFGLDRMVLHENLKAGLRKVLREHAERDRLAAYGLTPRSRLLLCGPSGVGKTMTAEAFAHETGLPLQVVRLDALITKYMGETGAKLRLIFDAIREHPGVYFFDEFDALATARSSENDIGEARRILNVLLVAMEGDIGTSLVFAATNLREILDRAIFRRFDAMFVYDNPTPAMARPLIEKALPESFSSFFGAIDWESISATSRGLSHDNLANAALDAARSAVLDHDGDLTTALLIEAMRQRGDGAVVSGEVPVAG